eukprot:765213-Hanusia_phi.AAC.5
MKSRSSGFRYAGSRDDILARTDRVAEGFLVGHQSDLCGARHLRLKALPGERKEVGSSSCQRVQVERQTLQLQRKTRQCPQIRRRFPQPG